jgi:hypothetical protein
MAMTDEQWAEYQRQGLHLRPEQRPDRMAKIDLGISDGPTLSDSQQLAKIVKLLSTIKNVLVFFLVVFIVGIVLSFVVEIAHSAH